MYYVMNKEQCESCRQCTRAHALSSGDDRWPLIIDIAFRWPRASPIGPRRSSGSTRRSSANQTRVNLRTLLAGSSAPLALVPLVHLYMYRTCTRSVTSNPELRSLANASQLRAH